MKNKESQENIILNYLKGNPKRKINATRALKVTGSKSSQSMNYLLPKMNKDGLIVRIKSGVYTLPTNTPTPRTTKVTRVAKTTPKAKVTISANESTLRSQLLAKKEAYLNKANAVDTQIKTLDNVISASSKLLK